MIYGFGIMEPYISFENSITAYEMMYRHSGIFSSRLIYNRVINLSVDIHFTHGTFVIHRGFIALNAMIIIEFQIKLYITYDEFSKKWT